MRRILVVLMLVASTASAQRTHILNPKIDSLFPDRQTGFLNDVTNSIRNPIAVNSRLAEIRRTQHINIVAVTLPTIKEYQPYEVALEVLRKWLVANRNDSLGAVTRNAGAVIMLVMDKHQCFISTATGTEGYITDATAGQLCKDQRDLFRAGNFGDGIINIANGIAVRGAQEAAVVTNVRPKSVPVQDDSDGTILWMLLTVFLVGIAGVCEFIYINNKREKDRIAKRNAAYALERAERLERERQENIERERIDRAERAQAVAREKARWEALTPAQQNAELAQKEVERRRVEAAAKAAAVLAAAAEAKRLREWELDRPRREAREAEERRQRAIREEEDAARRRSESTSYTSYNTYNTYNSRSDDSSSSSSSSSDSGGSDSSSGGGGGSEW